MAVLPTDPPSRGRVCGLEDVWVSRTLYSSSSSSSPAALPPSAGASCRHRCAHDERGAE
eukprot:CAMPEP_0170140590 /NCGR_PEP_ID=MMETSP0033_2-20121228/6456_1 /TAXON_ID=195969 /ORGANISM="Dolichomastix tenuilepis, Strain CCMP3274" /LENGTH=58 /DNA_ID=CAMNT_0010376805 /DNA_START=111 /DNA_END=284 /DNA_ORIENTATION=-